VQDPVLDRTRSGAPVFGAPRTRNRLAAVLILVIGCVVMTAAPARPDEVSDYEQAIPPALRGPFVSRPDVVTLLDCPDASCEGRLNFTRLVEARLPSGAPHTMANDNPFNHAVSRMIVAAIAGDIKERSEDRKVFGNRLNEKFLTDPNSRVQLVGVVNRMDRQFLKDPVRRGAQANCGEISVIYRFFYSIRDGRQASRLPVTMNLVFPALPRDAKKGAITCASIAQRWLDEMGRPLDRGATQVVSDLMDPASGPLALIDGRDLERIELNVQAYRAAASDPQASDFGTRAEYIIRVFQWSAPLGLFLPRFLNNQVNRDELLCAPGETIDCASKQSLRRRLVAYLQQPKVVASIDLGELDIPLSLARVDRAGVRQTALDSRGISVSPGGEHRSGNQPFWKASEAQSSGSGGEIISDPEIAIAIKNARRAGVQLHFIATENDFRVRLDQMSCTGCHQTRAIAGFHFPGADRKETPDSNAVFLPGSPHFYGDQPRRIEILKAIAKSGNAGVSQLQLAASYADRPDGRFDNELSATQILGGWGASCIVDADPSAKRNWGCQSDLLCSPVFASAAGHDRAGICMPPKEVMQIGDALQTGYVSAAGFDQDSYHRTFPVNAAPDDTRIPSEDLPAHPPANNSFYGAHQEFYQGQPNSPDKATRRDALTGGFPAGMLRLSECLGLPKEATCGLVAASGFNACIQKMSTDDRFNTNVCFRYFTAFAGMRACDASEPCRDDYICVRPISGYDSDDEAQKSFAARRHDLENPPVAYNSLVGQSPYDTTNFGEQKPDSPWVQRHDRRGYCIPPYFVFQFRSDGHPPPD
jgi:hypothetical protein